LEQFGSVFWYLGLTSPSNGYKFQKIQKKRFLFKINGFFEQKTVIFFQKKRFVLFFFTECPSPQAR
jgi:hypothetical protein